MRPRAGGAFALVQPLRPGERARLDLDCRLAESRARRDETAQQHLAAEAKLQRSLDDRRKRAELNARKRELRGSLHEAESKVKRLEALEAALEGAEGLLTDLAVCPVCRAPAQLEPRDGDCYLVKCRADGCEVVWGVHRQEAAGPRIPRMLPGDADPEAWPKDAALQWVDELLGCDALSVPAVAGDGSITFRPPR